MAKRRRKVSVPLLALFLVLLGAGMWLRSGIQPAAQGRSRYVRFEKPTRLAAALTELQRQGLVRNSTALRFYAFLTRRSQSVAMGTFSLSPEMSGPQILDSLAAPIRRDLRIPETNWANRTAHLLANKDVLNADEYMRLVHDPAQFQSEVSFPLSGKSLEGYLYPDTYDLPPLIGARAVIEKQLKTFDRKVWKKLQPKDLQRTLTIASMVQMESGRVQDEPMIAGVIENRLKKGMPLQIDSTLLYGIQKWRRLTFSDYKKIDSPYNTYTHKGLPPGPICSPTLSCIEAALNPARHNYLYYVALPTGETVFSKDYREHRKKIQARLHALALQKKVAAH